MLRTAKKTHYLYDLQRAKLSRNGYFKAIKRARSPCWLSFLARTTPQNIWTAKKFIAPRKSPYFLSLPDADSRVAINHALYGYFFPLIPQAPQKGRLTPHPSHLPFPKEEIALAVAKSTPSSASGPDEVPCSVWKSINCYNPDILLSHLAPLVAFGYHPPSLKHANRVVLDIPGKPAYDTRSSLRIIILLKTVSKILEQVMTVRHMALAGSSGLLYSN